jgi:hypothetical protein
LEVVEAAIAAGAAGILIARLSQLGVGLTARLFRRRAFLGRLKWWDLLDIGLPLVVWAYLGYVANLGPP